jgi:hypothetical protein
VLVPGRSSSERVPTTPSSSKPATSASVLSTALGGGGREGGRGGGGERGKGGGGKGGGGKRKSKYVLVDEAMDRLRNTYFGNGVPGVNRLLQYLDAAAHQLNDIKH